MRKLFCISVALLALAACNKNGQLTGDDPTRNNEGPGEGQPMDSSPSERKRLPETTPDQERPYADDSSPDQTPPAPSDSK